jgi:hypothetical protein
VCCGQVNAQRQQVQKSYIQLLLRQRQQQQQQQKVLLPSMDPHHTLCKPMLRWQRCSKLAASNKRNNTRVTVMSYYVTFEML